MEAFLEWESARWIALYDVGLSYSEKVQDKLCYLKQSLIMYNNCSWWPWSLWETLDVMDTVTDSRNHIIAFMNETRWHIFSKVALTCLSFIRLNVIFQCDQRHLILPCSLPWVIWWIKSMIFVINQGHTSYHSSLFIDQTLWYSLLSIMLVCLANSNDALLPMPRVTY